MSGRTNAPFIYPGGKHRAAPLIWERLGAEVGRYIEPFAGSLAVLLARPRPGLVEVVNDADGFVVNAWRSIRYDPAGVAWWLTGPASSADLVTRHRWVHTEGRERVAAVFTDPAHFDVQTAAWFIYGLNVAVHPRAFLRPDERHGRPATDACAQGHLALSRQPLDIYLAGIAARLERTMILAGDWSACLTSSMLSSHADGTLHSTAAVFLDPPYDDTLRRGDLYGADSATVAVDVLAWCRKWGNHPQLRVCLAGYASEHDGLETDGWTVEAWSSDAGGKSRHDERLWFSPGCLKPAGQASLFDGEDAA